MDLEHLLGLAQYSLDSDGKSVAMLSGLNELTAMHREACPAYRRILDAIGARSAASTVSEVPFLPVSLFKRSELVSVPDDEVFKVLTSSGTTGQIPSRIHLDVATSRLQTRALTSIVTHYIGGRRLPMLIVDHPGVVRDRRKLSARGAGILGMANYGRDHHYLLDDDLVVDRRALNEWLVRHDGEPLLLFGFTFMVWRHLYEELGESGIDLSKAVLVHSGGWKKLAEIAVTNDVFKAELNRAFGLARVHNFYGMVEQVGSVFFECPDGVFHPPNFAEVVVRDPETWDALEPGRQGVLEVLSLLPRSYPGHALLTEDLGTVLGVDDCSCGRMGARLLVSGRLPKAEIRGCSDVLAQGV